MRALNIADPCCQMDTTRTTYIVVHVMRVPVPTAWRVLGFRIEETAKVLNKQFQIAHKVIL